MTVKIEWVRHLARNSHKLLEHVQISMHLQQKSNTNTMSYVHNIKNIYLSFPSVTKYILFDLVYSQGQQVYHVEEDISAALRAFFVTFCGVNYVVNLMNYYVTS